MTVGRRTETWEQAPEQAHEQVEQGDVASTPTEETGLPQGNGRQEPGAVQRQPKKPFYPRLLRLRHVSPNAWQRALLGEGALAVAVVLVLADLATAWTLLVLPLAVALVVKGHDVLAGLLDRQPQVDAGPEADREGAADTGTASPETPADTAVTSRQ